MANVFNQEAHRIGAIILNTTKEIQL